MSEFNRRKTEVSVGRFMPWKVCSCAVPSFCKIVFMQKIRLVLPFSCCCSEVIRPWSWHFSACGSCHRLVAITRPSPEFSVRAPHQWLDGQPVLKPSMYWTTRDPPALHLQCSHGWLASRTRLSKIVGRLVKGTFDESQAHCESGEFKVDQTKYALPLRGIWILSEANESLHQIVIGRSPRQVRVDSISSEHKGAAPRNGQRKARGKSDFKSWLCVLPGAAFLMRLLTPQRPLIPEC